MSYLHKDKYAFVDAINLASTRFAIVPSVAEKDYYVTMILKELSQRMPFIVFKGGTSLSKCFKIINRFSEDIDITIDTKISQGQMRKLKESIQDVARLLGLSIPNIDETKSRRNYNKYLLQYKSVIDEEENSVIIPTVIMETSFTEISFPTEIHAVDSYIGEMMRAEAPDTIEQFQLNPFDMKVQGINRTLADKVFLLCDYYLKGTTDRHSRHIYDIYKLLPLVQQNSDFKALVHEVRNARAQTNSCPSAQPNVNVPELLRSIIAKNIYKFDYEDKTSKILDESISYEVAIEALKAISSSTIFEN